MQYASECSYCACRLKCSCMSELIYSPPPSDRSTLCILWRTSSAASIGTKVFINPFWSISQFRMCVGLSIAVFFLCSGHHNLASPVSLAVATVSSVCEVSSAFVTKSSKLSTNSKNFEFCPRRHSGYELRDFIHLKEL